MISQCGKTPQVTALGASEFVVGAHVTLRIDSVVGDLRVSLYPRDQGVEVFWRHEEFEVAFW